MTEISACLVTRGDVDMGPVLDSLPFDDVVVWDNSKRPDDFKCYGRFAAIAEAKHDLIYTQDDDVIVPTWHLLAEYHAIGDTGWIVANRPPEEEWRFLGLGAIFHRGLVTGAFRQYADEHGFDEDFLRVADVVFAYQRPYRSVWVGYDELPWARAENRMYLQPDHYTVRERARERSLALAGG